MLILLLDPHIDNIPITQNIVIPLNKRWRYFLQQKYHDGEFFLQQQYYNLKFYYNFKLYYSFGIESFIEKLVIYYHLCFHMHGGRLIILCW